MNTHKLKLILLALGTIFLSSCSELLYTSLDILRPAKVTFAANANNILIVNNTAVQPENLGHRIELLNQKTKNVLLRTDSIPLFCLSSLTEELESNGFFSTVKLITKSVNSTYSFSLIHHLDADTVNKLCNQYNTDVILSLDKIKVNDDVSEYYLEESSSFLAALEVRYESTWSIHYPNKTDVTPINFKDTIYWESQSYTRKSVLDGLPNQMDGIIDGALNVGKKSIARFLPYWEKVDRYFYNSKDKLLRQGMDSIYVKNWKAAISIWEKAYESKNAMTQSMAANNIAIAYEITGDIEKALDYAYKAYYSLGKSNFSEADMFIRFQKYIGELIQRKADIAVLKKQLGE